MCRRVDCSACGRPTYAGCGAHIEQVLGGVPANKRCQCREERAARKQAGGSQGGSWLGKLFNRSGS